MGVIKSILDALTTSEVSKMRSERDSARIMRDHYNGALVRMEEKHHAFLKECDDLRTRNERLIAENMDLTKRYVVPDVMRRANPWFSELRTVTGRVPSCGGARLSNNCKLSFRECADYCMVGVDFAALEARVLASTTRPPRFYALSYDQKGKEPKQSSWFYVYDRDSNGGHVARFIDKDVADQYVLFRNSME